MQLWSLSCRLRFHTGSNSSSFVCYISKIICWICFFFGGTFPTKKHNHKPQTNSTNETNSKGSNRSDALGFVGSGGGALVAAGPILAVLVGRRWWLVARSTSFGGSALFLGCQNVAEAGQQSKLGWTKRGSFFNVLQVLCGKGSCLFCCFIYLFILNLTSCSCLFFLLLPRVFSRFLHVVDMAKKRIFILSWFYHVVSSCFFHNWQHLGWGHAAPR